MTQQSEPNKPWTLERAVLMCREVEAVCPAHGFHVALTGGTLYKTGRRKDADILFYPICEDGQDLHGLSIALRKLGFEFTLGGELLEQFCNKAMFRGRPVDVFFPTFGFEYTPAVTEDATADLFDAIPEGDGLAKEPIVETAFEGKAA